MKRNVFKDGLVLRIGNVCIKTAEYMVYRHILVCEIEMMQQEIVEISDNFLMESLLPCRHSCDDTLTELKDSYKVLAMKVDIIVNKLKILLDTTPHKGYKRSFIKQFKG